MIRQLICSCTVALLVVGSSDVGAQSASPSSSVAPAPAGTIPLGYHVEEHPKWALVGAGAALSLIGIGTFFAGVAQHKDTSSCRDPEMCDFDNQDLIPYYFAGLGLFAAGVATSIVGLAWQTKTMVPDRTSILRPEKVTLHLGGITSGQMGVGLRGVW